MAAPAVRTAQSPRDGCKMDGGGRSRERRSPVEGLKVSLLYNHCSCQHLQLKNYYSDESNSHAFDVKTKYIESCTNETESHSFHVEVYCDAYGIEVCNVACGIEVYNNIEVYSDACCIEVHSNACGVEVYSDTCGIEVCNVACGIEVDVFNINTIDVYDFEIGTFRFIVSYQVRSRLGYPKKALLGHWSRAVENLTKLKAEGVFAPKQVLAVLNQYQGAWPLELWESQKLSLHWRGSRAVWTEYPSEKCIFGRCKWRRVFDLGQEHCGGFSRVSTILALRQPSRLHWPSDNPQFLKGTHKEYATLAVSWQQRRSAQLVSVGIHRCRRHEQKDNVHHSVVLDIGAHDSARLRCANEYSESAVQPPVPTGEGGDVEGSSLCKGRPPHGVAPLGDRGGACQPPRNPPPNPHNTSERLIATVAERLSTASLQIPPRLHGSLGSRTRNPVILERLGDLCQEDRHLQNDDDLKMYRQIATLKKGAWRSWRGRALSGGYYWNEFSLAHSGTFHTPLRYSRRLLNLPEPRFRVQMFVPSSSKCAVFLFQLRGLADDISCLHHFVLRGFTMLDAFSRNMSTTQLEQRRNERARETGDPRENPPTGGIVRHDSHMRKIRELSCRESNPVRLAGKRAV
ncbi:hypothetical protein PR048_017078 [Dryococelus australis]|uniref:Uncharacterized protein n=1 Tax=Dryococelus australis TaxID=614101 RepID=A0ABQ9H8I3_9NEOP|nr:hypothetical protein PR048_017078 [Dryococelus australis]